MRSKGQNLGHLKVLPPWPWGRTRCRDICADPLFPPQLFLGALWGARVLGKGSVGHCPSQPPRSRAPSGFAILPSRERHPPRVTAHAPRTSYTEPGWGSHPLQVPLSPGLGGSQRPTNSPNCFSHSIRPPDQSKERGRGSGEQRRPSYPRAETLHPLATHRKPVVSTYRCWDHKPGTPRNGLKSSYSRKRIQQHG